MNDRRCGYLTSRFSLPVSILASTFTKPKQKGPLNPFRSTPTWRRCSWGHRDRSPCKRPADFVFAGKSGRPRWRGGCLPITSNRRREGPYRQDSVGTPSGAHFQLWSTARGGGTWLCKRSFCGTGLQNDDEYLHAGCRSSKAESNPKAHQEVAGGMKWYELYSPEPAIPAKWWKSWYARGGRV
jgi:hypothetical protein